MAPHKPASTSLFSEKDALALMGVGWRLWWNALGIYVAAKLLRGIAWLRRVR